MGHKLQIDAYRRQQILELFRSSIEHLRRWGREEDIVRYSAHCACVVSSHRGDGVGDA
jgi:hypothetical protein